MDCGSCCLRAALRVVVLVQQVLAPWWARRFARAGSWRAWRTPPPRPAAQTDSAPRRSARTWARRRCRSRGSKPAPAWRSARRHRESPARSPCPASRLRLMFSISTVASSTRMPTASASPPSVMMLMVSCSSAQSMRCEHRIESGIETAMISVERQLPRKIRIMTAVRQAAMMRLAHHAVDGAAHENRLIARAN